MNPLTLICVWFLTGGGAAGPAPHVEYMDANPHGTMLCRMTGRPICDGVTAQTYDGTIISVYPRTASRYLQVREAWNAARLARGLAVMGDAIEDEGDAWAAAHWRLCP